MSKTLRQDASNTAGVLAAFSKEDKNMVEDTIAEYVRLLSEKDLKRIYTVTVGRSIQIRFSCVKRGGNRPYHASR